MVNIYRFLDYRELLREFVEHRKKTEGKFGFAVLAEKLGVQKTYISKVLAGNAHLSQDQIFLLAESFSLNEEQREYFSLLVESERTGVVKRKKIIRSKIAQIQFEKRNPAQALLASELESTGVDDFSKYYLDPYTAIVHLCFDLPRFQHRSNEVRNYLNLSESHMAEICNSLVALGLIKKLNENQFQVLKDHFHLPRESPLAKSGDALVRMLSANQIFKVPPEKRFAFSVTFSGDDSTRAFIHEEFLKFLREVEKMVQSAPSTEVLQMNFDLFPWTN